MKPEHAFEYLQHAHAAGRLAQAYIVVGNPKTVGGDFATRLMQLVFCATPGAACGACVPCRQIAQRTHADSLWIEPQKKSRQIVIEQVRDLQHRVQQTAFAGGWKACVIGGADRLNAAASNAFLKTLEEPAGNSLFMLLTDTPQSLLPTILSRCQLFVLDDEAATATEWDRALLAILIEGRTLDALGSPMFASMALAERILGLLEAMREEAEKAVSAQADAEAVDQDDETLDARASSLYREWRTGVMRTLLLWFRDRLILASSGDTAHLRFPEHAAILQAQATGLTRVEALRQVRLVEDMHQNLERNLPERLVIGSGFPRLVAV
ncbi:MAG: hypothetical protein K8T26_07805 [Lentisphaerae bacterium]|nr:hypothetical protein [Lentisphaerota bacterium]